MQLTTILRTISGGEVKLGLDLQFLVSPGQRDAPSKVKVWLVGLCYSMPSLTSNSAAIVGMDPNFYSLQGVMLLLDVFNTLFWYLVMFACC